ncbi:MAG: hypothetical protein AAF502_16350 [Bacteroidota bacterium]
MKTKLSFLFGCLCLLFVNLASAQSSTTHYVELVVVNDPAMIVEVEELDLEMTIHNERGQVKSLHVKIDNEPVAFNPLATAGTHDIASGGEFESRDGKMKISIFEATAAERRKTGVTNDQTVIFRLVIE